MSNPSTAISLEELVRVLKNNEITKIQAALNNAAAFAVQLDRLSSLTSVEDIIVQKIHRLRSHINDAEIQIDDIEFYVETSTYPSLDRDFVDYTA